jgi:hypothetical protein
VTEVEVRRFAEADRAQLLALSGRAGEGAPTASLWVHEESEVAVYLTPYLDFEPESVFVAIVDGEPAGYLAGSLGTAVPSESVRMDRAIREYRLFLRRGPALFFARSLLDMARLCGGSRPRASSKTPAGPLTCTSTCFRGLAAPAPPPRSWSAGSSGFSTPAPRAATSRPSWRTPAPCGSSNAWASSPTAPRPSSPASGTSDAGCTS